MFGTGQGSFHLFRIKGIDVFLNWTWFLVASVRDPGSQGQIQFRRLERDRVPRPLCHRSDARIRPRARLPLRRRHRRQDHALASWRRRLCQSASAARRNPLEHRRRPAGQCRSGHSACGGLVNGPVAALAILDARCIPTDCAQSSSPTSFYLSSIFFPSIPSMAARSSARCSGFLWAARAACWLPSSLGFFGVAGLHRSGSVDPIHLDGPHRRLRRNELLERLQNRARPPQTRKNPPPPGIRLPQLPHRAAHRPLLALQQVRYPVRHLRDRRRLPAVFRPIREDHLPRLPPHAPISRVAGRLRPRRRRDVSARNRRADNSSETVPSAAESTPDKMPGCPGSKSQCPSA